MVVVLGIGASLTLNTAEIDSSGTCLCGCFFLDFSFLRAVDKYFSDCLTVPNSGTCDSEFDKFSLKLNSAEIEDLDSVSDDVVDDFFDCDTDGLLVCV